MASRDDFSSQVARLLGDRVGWRCSRPDCRALTKGSHSTDLRAISVGVAAHIHAAAPGGPRYDPTQTPVERASFDNGIHLCATDATLIDRDVVSFPTSLLREWKEKAERRTQEELGRPAAVDDPSSLSFHVSLFSEDPEPWASRPETRVQYQLSQLNDVLTIKANLAYLNALEAGGPIEPLSCMRPVFGWDFPKLDFKMVNNTPQTIYVTEAVFDIEQSEVDPRPLIVIKEDSQGRTALQLPLLNEGWGRATDVAIDFNLIVSPNATEPTWGGPMPDLLSANRA